MIEGRCLCGAIRYRLRPPFVFFGHCHCSMCRKHHGASFVTWVATAPDALEWLEGEGLVAGRPSSEHGARSWCPRCGSTVAARSEQMAFAPAGNLVGSVEGRPTLHMFVGSRAPWVEIDDELARHEAWPDAANSPAPVERPVPASRDGAIGGSCLCGTVAFEIEGMPDGMRHCHCSRCRLARGAAHATNLFVPPERVRFVRGGDRVVDYALPGAERFGIAFCAACGSHTARIVPGRPYAVIPAGVLDDDPGLRPNSHIYVGSKADWFEITDDLPRFEEAPPPG